MKGTWSGFKRSDYPKWKTGPIQSDLGYFESAKQRDEFIKMWTNFNEKEEQYYIQRVNELNMARKYNEADVELSLKLRKGGTVTESVTKKTNNKTNKTGE